MVTTQVIAKLSPAALFTVSKVVRQSIVPPLEPAKIPASVIAPVPVPAGKVAVVAIVADDGSSSSVL